MFEMAKMLFGNSIFSPIARFSIVLILVQQSAYYLNHKPNNMHVLSF